MTVVLALEEISFHVLGTPGAKGSSRAFVNRKTGGAHVAPGGSKSGQAKAKAWETAVREAAGACVSATAPPFVDIPIFVSITFRMARSANHWGRGRNAGKLAPSAPHRPRTKPDIDKLARSTLDAMTGIVFDDDSRIVALVLEKQYAAPGREGASIRVTRST